MFDINHFGTWDYFTVGVTLLFPIFIGIYYAIVNKQSNEELLVGGREMNIFAISARYHNNNILIHTYYIHIITQK